MKTEVLEYFRVIRVLVIREGTGRNCVSFRCNSNAIPFWRITKLTSYGREEGGTRSQTGKGWSPRKTFALFDVSMKMRVVIPK